jgi:hypothetical protein
MTMVGVRVELNEVSPSPVGANLEVDAVLERVAGRRLMVTVSVRDSDRPIACGRVTRPRCASAECSRALLAAGGTTPNYGSRVRSCLWCSLGRLQKRLDGEVEGECPQEDLQEVLDRAVEAADE